MTSTVFVVDDNDDFRSSLAWVLRGEGHKTVEFNCARKAISALKISAQDELRNCCVLLDVRMPEISGLELHEIIRREHITVPVIYMTGHADIELAVEAMKKGAITFLEKPLNPEKLHNAIQSALSTSFITSVGERSITVDQHHQAEFQRLLSTLTPRETEVLQGIVEGSANKIVARKLDISVRTVEVHRSRIMKKLNVRSASDLVKHVMAGEQMR